MAELRWILLGLGIAFCLGLWWWETRRRRQASGSLRDFEPEDPPYLSSPSVSPAGRTPEPAWREHAPAPTPRVEPTLDPLSMDHSDDDGHGHTTQEADPSGAPEETEPAPAEPRGSRQALDDRIVSVRVLATPDQPFPGSLLLAAMRSTGLEFGKFSIFHKHRADGTPVFSVASLVEPGSFELDQMPAQTFRGITFFAIAREAGQDGLADMRQTARQVAAKLRGTLTES